MSTMLGLRHPVYAIEHKYWVKHEYWVKETSRTSISSDELHTSILSKWRSEVTTACCRIHSYNIIIISFLINYIRIWLTN